MHSTSAEFTHFSVIVEMGCINKKVRLSKETVYHGRSSHGNLVKELGDISLNEIDRIIIILNKKITILPRRFHDNGQVQGGSYTW